ncbi:MAG: hypothetical protein JO283_07120 [Bradyrhizobium sp.]|nr:hypothetical protein [Bradyrhizobium sp.]
MRLCHCSIDGEAILSDDSGLAVFDLIRSRRHDRAVLCAVCRFEDRKARLARLLPKPFQSIALNEYFARDGPVIFKQAYKLGREGIVSKRLGSTHRSGRSRQMGQGQESGGAGSAA